jgi:DNA-binding NtrC family response regulator
MKKFIANSEESKKVLNIAQMASGLPVNVLILGSIGVGKKLLANQISTTAMVFDAKTLEHQINHNSINLDEYSELIVSNLQNVLNKEEFLESLEGKKVIATTTHIVKDVESLFAIKIEISDLKDREEDLEEIIKIYSNEAKSIYDIEDDIDELDYDLSENGISLKKSIYKNILIKSLNKDDIERSLQFFIQKELREDKEYKELLGLFEIPLLKAAKDEFKSQLQMANRLNINRITLRKKLEHYFG